MELFVITARNPATTLILAIDCMATQTGGILTSKVGGKGRGRQPGRGRGATRANAAQVPRNHNVEGTLVDADKAGLENVSNEDWATLKSLWNSHKSTTRLSGKGKLQWILTQVHHKHMTGVFLDHCG